MVRPKTVIAVPYSSRLRYRILPLISYAEKDGQEMAPEQVAVLNWSEEPEDVHLRVVVWFFLCGGYDASFILNLNGVISYGKTMENDLVQKVSSIRHPASFPNQRMLSNLIITR